MINREQRIKKRKTCCNVTSVFGRSLYQGVIYVSIFSMVSNGVVVFCVTTSNIVIHYYDFVNALCATDLRARTMEIVVCTLGPFFQHWPKVMGLISYESTRDGLNFIIMATMLKSSVNMGMSVIMFVMAVTVIGILSTKDLISRNPAYAANLVLVLVICPMSVYQFIISGLLLYQAVKLSGNQFLCSLWFTSHVGILLVYGMLFLTKIIASFYAEHYVSGCFTIFAAVVYEAVYIYLMIVVNSYQNDLEKDIYY